MIALADLPVPLRKAATSALGVYAAYIAHGIRHPSLAISSATRKEREAPLPGDALVGDPDWTTDFATTIRASPGYVWPWLVQIGYGRAGWYSWYRFDNNGVASADIIVPALQQLGVGDIVPDGPRVNEGYGVWWVRELTPLRSLVLHSRRHPSTGLEMADPDPAPPFIDVSWSFVLHETEIGHTRLHVRVRAKLHTNGNGRLKTKLLRLFFGIGDSVFENTMLDGIRSRAEALAWAMHEAKP